MLQAASNTTMTEQPLQSIVTPASVPPPMTGNPQASNGVPDAPTASFPTVPFPAQGFPTTNRSTGGNTSADGGEAPSPAKYILSSWTQFARYRSMILDRLAPHALYRWLGLAGGICLFLLRMFLLEGFYLYTYCLFIFLLNQLILFLQPKDRASLVAAAANREQGEEESGPALPTADSDEFRPFVRRLPEFRFWYSSSVATFVCFCITFFPFLDVPVYWPVLVVYFLFLVVATFRRQWLDMKRLKYVPWDMGKKKYTSDPKAFVVKRNNAATAAQAMVQKQSSAMSSSRPANASPIPTMTVPRKASAKKSAQD